MALSRREFMGKSLLGAGTALSFSNSWANVIKESVFTNSPDVIIEITAKPKSIKIEDGTKRRFLSYEGRLIKGSVDCLGTIDNSFLGPTINVKTGDQVRIIFKNNISEKSIIHWHGLDVSHENDGHPSKAINTGESYQYDFVVENRAGMYWYHPHPHGRTGYQVYQGLSGLFIVRDEEEKRMKLPDGDQELNLVVQDRYFNEEGELEYRPTMMGAHGNTLFINGHQDRRLKVKSGLNRIRLLNGCNARVFNVALDDGQNIKQIGSDGGLLGEVKLHDRFFFSPAERVDFLVDFTNYRIGEVVKLVSLPLVEGRGSKYTMIEFEISDEGRTFEEPLSLPNLEEISPSEASNQITPKQFDLIFKRGVGWTINGNGYQSDNYTESEIIKFGDTEVWEFYNPTGMPHPMHVHGTQFQILSREPGQLKGCLDEGWKDTVLVMPGDRVKIIKRFDTFKGTFLYHCHNLEHEDMSMMRNFKVVD